MVPNMSKKKVFLLLIILVVMTSLFSNTVFGQQGGLGGIADTFYNLFGFISDLVTVEKLVDNNTAALFWAKFLIWLLLFSVIYFGAGFVFRERNKVQIVVAFAIALMGTVAIPNTVIIGIFSTYSLAAGVIVWFVPVAAGLFVAHKIENRMLKAVFYLLLLIILFNIDGSLTKAKAISGGAYEYFKLLMAVVFIAFFVNLGAAFGVSGQEAAGWLGGRARGAWNRVTKRPERDEELPGGDHGGEAIEGERHTQEQLESIQNLRQKLTETEAQLQQYIQNPDIRQRFNNIAALLTQLREIQQDLDATENEVRGRI